jgi:hypothetical protein
MTFQSCQEVPSAFGSRLINPKQNSEDAQRIFDFYTPEADPTEFMSAENDPVTHAALTAFSDLLNTL